MYLGHRYVAGITGLYLVWTPVTLLDWNMHSWRLWLISAPFLAFMCLLLWGDSRHDHRLCLTCADGMPLDGNGAAAKRDRTLRAWHSGKLYLALALLFVLAVSGGWWLTHLIGLTSRQAYVPQMIGVVTPGVTLPHLSRVHRQLHPWCPYCGHGRGGGGWMSAPVPDGPKVKEPA